MNLKRYGIVVVAVLVAAGIGYWIWTPVEERSTEEEPLPGETITVYFLDREDYVLRPVERTVDEAPGQPERIKQIVGELTTPPEDTGLIQLAPGDLELRSSYLKDSTVYLDFNDGLVGAAQGTSGERMLLYSIVNSVLENVSSDYKLVQFLIEGEQRKTIGAYGEESGHIAIRYPLGPRWNLADTSP